MPAQPYTRDPNGIRLDLEGGMNLMLSPDLLTKGFPFLQNVRRNLYGRAVDRPGLGANLLPSTLPAGPTSLIRMNDATPVGPASGYVLIIGAAGTLYLYVGASVMVSLASGLSGLPLSFVTFRPNASPQPWCYVADPSLNVTIPGYPATIYGNPIAGMLKVRSDGTTFKTGIAEPQAAPVVTASTGTGPTWVMYRYVYRSSITGALSNPSPESAPVNLAQVSATRSLSVPSTYSTNFHYTVGQWEYDSGTNTFRVVGGVPNGTLLDYVTAYNFGFTTTDVPDGVTIDGVLVTLNWSGQAAGNGSLANVSLFYQNAAYGLVKSPGALNYLPVGSAGTDVTQGGNTDTWGATLTPAVIRDTSFGFGVQVEVVTGRSFLYTYSVTVYYTDINTGVSGTASTDPQVDLIDFYRMDPGLDNFTYVGTVPNGTSVFNDTLSDLAVSNNQILQFDNYEPFPSIDLPAHGNVNVALVGSGSQTVVTYIVQVGTTPFNVRWLPGTIITINGIAYTLYNRPVFLGGTTYQLTAVNITTDPTTGFIVSSYPPVASAVPYQISEPILAAQPSPVIWGPTPDNAGSFYFGLDPLNTGDLLWSKGNNFDSAPDTNRMAVTTPSELLMNGTITSELSTVFSTERFWLIYPNFADALATVTGTEGQQWTLIQSTATRGLYMRYAICALGSLIAYRAKDCIAISMGGGAEQSITDDIRSLFPQAGTFPEPVTIAGYTVYPPDDTKPNAQTIAITPGYIFYDYQDTTGTPRTLVYDLEAKGWCVDVYSPIANVHCWAVGVNQLLLGCTDGTVRRLGDGGEIGSAILATRCENGGDARALKRVGDIFVRVQPVPTYQITISLYRSRFTAALTSYGPTMFTGSGALISFIVNFTSGFGVDVDDIEAVFGWPVGTGQILDTWQPDWVMLPEIIQDRPSDWTDCGIAGNKLIRGMIVEMDTFNVGKGLQVERSDTETLVAPNQGAITANGQTLVPFTFTPFTAHLLRLVSTDGVSWRLWGPDAKWIADPWPDYTPLYSAWNNLGVNGAKYIRQLVLPMDTNGLPASFAVATSDGASVAFSATTPTAVKTQVAFPFVPPIVAHEVQIQCQTNTGIWTDEAQWFFDSYPEITLAYTPIMEVGGPDNKFVQGISIVGDSGGVPVQFRILYDGGQLGPLTDPRVFNGKQTQVYSFSPPLVAHDLQVVPQQNVRIWMAGMGAEDTSKWDYQPYPDSATTWATEASSFGLLGYIHLYQINLAYIATQPVTVTITTDTTDPGTFTMTFPAAGSGTQPAKILIKAPPNKWKVASLSFTSSTPFSIWKDLTEVWLKPWGSTGEYQKTSPFGADTTAAAQI